MEIHVCSLTCYDEMSRDGEGSVPKSPRKTQMDWTKTEGNM
jgi:hypothetical protein